MNEIWFIFVHLLGGTFATLGLLALILVMSGFYLDFDWDDYESELKVDLDDEEEHF